MSPADRRRNLRRASDLERDTARALGTERVHRERGKSAPDVKPIVVGNTRLVAECKVRRRLPALIVSALQQAQAYSPGAVPIAVVREHRGPAIVCLDLDAFVMLLGLDPIVLPTVHRPTPRSAKQLVIAGCT